MQENVEGFIRSCPTFGRLRRSELRILGSAGCQWQLYYSLEPFKYSKRFRDAIGGQDSRMVELGFLPTCLTGVNLSASLVCLLLLYLCAMVSPKAQFLAPFCIFCTTLLCIQLPLYMGCLITYTRTTISSTRDSGSVTAPTKLVPSPLSPPALARPNSGPRPIV